MTALVRGPGERAAGLQENVSKPMPCWIVERVQRVTLDFHFDRRDCLVLEEGNR